MNRFQSLSAWFRRLSRRERRVVAAGALVSALAVLAGWVVLPFARHWQDRETAIAAKQAQLAQLRALVEGEVSTRQSLGARQHDRTVLRRQLLTGPTPALAASDLQSLLQGYADDSRVMLDQVDLVAEPGPTGKEGLPVIPVELSAQGDIYGLAEFLARLQYGGKLLVVDELRVNASEIRGGGPQVLTWSVRLHGATSSK
jgi:type II secretory pathway component PulM